MGSPWAATDRLYTSRERLFSDGGSVKYMSYNRSECEVITSKESFPGSCAPYFSQPIIIIINTG